MSVSESGLELDDGLDDGVEHELDDDPVQVLDPEHELESGHEPDDDPVQELDPEHELESGHEPELDPEVVPD